MSTEMLGELIRAGTPHMQAEAIVAKSELTEARAEIARLQSIANELGRQSAKAELKLTLAKEGLLEIARVWDGYAPVRDDNDCLRKCNGGWDARQCGCAEEARNAYAAQL
jgi:hypothetical protein